MASSLTPPAPESAAIPDEQQPASEPAEAKAEDVETATPEAPATDEKDRALEDMKAKWPGWPGYSVFRLLVPVLKVGGIIEETRARVRVLDGPITSPDRIMGSTAEEIVSEAECVAFMMLALEQGKLALDSLEVPVGCIIVEDQKVISSGRNRTTETRNATRHAEMEAIDVLLEQWQKNGLTKEDIALKFSKCTLYVTCEPCIMCAAALSIIGLQEVYYGCANDKFGGCGSIFSLHTKDHGNLPSGGTSKRKGFKCTGGIMATEAINLLRSFYEQGNPNAPKPHRTVVPRV